MSAARCVEWSWKYGQERCPHRAKAGRLCEMHLRYAVLDLTAQGVPKAEATRRVISTPRSPHPFMEAAPEGRL